MARRAKEEETRIRNATLNATAHLAYSRGCDHKKITPEEFLRNIGALPPEPARAKAKKMSAKEIYKGAEEVGRRFAAHHKSKKKEG